jgi:hypothetical protein
VNRVSSSRPGIRRGAAGWAAAAALLLAAEPLHAQDRQPEESGSSVPFAKAWNIASQGKAGSSGELLFRVTPSDGDDPVEVSVFVLSGANETGVASSIHRALSTQLDSSRYDVEAGQGANVLITADDSTAAGRASPGFGLELIDSDIDDVRVTVQNAAPVAPPTVPAQAGPPSVPESTATPAPHATAPGSPGSPARSPESEASTPDGGAGARASAPPPPPGPGDS